MEFRLSGKLTKTIHFRAYVYDFFHLFWCEELEFCPDISNTSSICQALSLKWCIHRSVVGFKLSKCLRLKTAWIPHKGQFFIVNLGPLGHEVMPSGRMMSLPSFSREDGRICRYLPVVVNTVEWFRCLLVFVNTVEWCRYLPDLWTL